MLRLLVREHGANWLNNFDGPLTEFYLAEGFKVDTRDSWNEEYAPPEWNYDLFGTPDYVTMGKDDSRRTSTSKRDHLGTDASTPWGRLLGATLPVPRSSVGLRRGVGDDRSQDGFSAPVKVAKSDEYENLVFGWASVAFSKDGSQIMDRQGHAIDVEDLEAAAYDFNVVSGKTGDMHQSDGFGQLVESMVFTDEKIELLGLDKGSIQKGWWVGFRVPPEYHKQVREGNRTMFSIEGTAKLEPFTD
jgi:hypothetical protein